MTRAPSSLELSGARSSAAEKNHIATPHRAECLDCAWDLAFDVETAEQPTDQLGAGRFEREISHRRPSIDAAPA